MGRWSSASPCIAIGGGTESVSDKDVFDTIPDHLWHTYGLEKLLPDYALFDRQFSYQPIQSRENNVVVEMTAGCKRNPKGDPGLPRNALV